MKIYNSLQQLNNLNYQVRKNKVELFGNQQNKVFNYEYYKPKYNNEFLEHIIKNQKNRENYLDFACGTGGSLLFKLAPQFTQYAFGNDISEQQLKVAKQLAEDYNNSLKKQNQQQKSCQVTIIEGDGMKLDQIIKQNLQKEIKFDLITIGQALHWFDVDKILLHCCENLLKNDGHLYILGYYTLGFNYNYNDQKFDKEGLKHYQKFYNIIGKYFYCDRAELSRGYPNYPFQKYFKNIQKFEKIDKIEYTLYEFYKYCKSYTAYNTYLQKFSQEIKEKQFLDPTDILYQEAQLELNEYMAKNNLQKTEKEIVMNNYLFMWKLSNI